MSGDAGVESSRHDNGIRQEREEGQEGGGRQVAAGHCVDADFLLATMGSHVKFPQGDR